MRVAGVVFVPFVHVAAAALADGFRGGRPPRARRSSAASSWSPLFDALRWEEGDGLMLGWEGRLVREGLDRLDWVGFEGPGEVPGRWTRTSTSTPTPAELPEALWRAWEAAWSAQTAGLGYAQLVDDEGFELLAVPA